MAGEGIPEDLKERARMFAEWDDCHAALTDWEIEAHRARPQVRRRRTEVDYMDGDFVVELVQRLRDLADEAQEHGLLLNADVHGLSAGPGFDGLAACADEVHGISPIHGEAGVRVARWDACPGSVSVYERKDAA